MDLNLIDNAIRYKFTDAPILAVSISETPDDNIVVLVATVSSVHQLKFSHPNRMQKNQDETHAYSVFHAVYSGQSSRDPTASLFHAIGHATGSSK